MKIYSLLSNVFTAKLQTPRVVNFLVMFLVFKNSFSVAANFTKIVSLSGPPLPDWPFLSVWNAPTENCAKKWNVSLNLSSFDVVANKNMSWYGDFVTIFYQNQIGLFPYFDSNGVAVNGGLPQVGKLHLAKELNFDLLKFFRI